MPLNEAPRVLEGISEVACWTCTDERQADAVPAARRSPGDEPQHRPGPVCSRSLNCETHPQLRRVAQRRRPGDGMKALRKDGPGTAGFRRQIGDRRVLPSVAMQRPDGARHEEKQCRPQPHADARETMHPRI